MRDSSRPQAVLRDRPVSGRGVGRELDTEAFNSEGLRAAPPSTYMDMSTIVVFASDWPSGLDSVVQ